MGLKEVKKLEREKEFEEFLLSYGITKQDLVYLHDVIQKVREEKKAEYQAQKISDEEKKSIKEKMESTNRISTPEELVKEFGREIERFYPNGDKPKK